MTTPKQKKTLSPAAHLRRRIREQRLADARARIQRLMADTREHTTAWHRARAQLAADLHDRPKRSNELHYLETILDKFDVAAPRPTREALRAEQCAWIIDELRRRSPPLPGALAPRLEVDDERS